MSSRAEEKERRRQERLEQQATAAGQARRARNLRLGASAALAAVIGAAAVIVVISTGGDDTDSTPTRSAGAARIPDVRVGNLEDAARAAGCRLRTSPDAGSSHVEGPVKYATNPPTSGDHAQVPADDGVYRPGDAPATEASVHSLEHGRINIQYTAALPARRIAQLETLAGEEDGYHVLLFRNRTRMATPVAATAWTRQLTCERFTDATFDAIRAFRRSYVDKGPEFVP